MTHSHPLRTACRAFVSDVRGQLAIFTAIVAGPVFLLAGVAVDYHLAVNSKEKVQAAMDSAVIAGARSLQKGRTESEIRDDVRRYFDAMVTDETHGLTCEDVAVDFPTGTTDVTAAVDCRQAVTILPLLGKDWIELSTNAASTYGVRKIDVAMVFDVSGSMNSSAAGSSQSKIEDLRDAALEGVKELLPDGSNPDAPDVRIALVPYNHAINAGSYFTALTGASGTRAWNAEREQSGAWVATTYTTSSACIYEREGIEAFTDAPPGAGAWLGAGAPVWDFDAGGAAKNRGDNWLRKVGSNCERVVHQGGGPFGAPFSQGRCGSSKSTAVSRRYDLCPSSSILPLTSSKTDLDAHINGLSANRGTNGSLGFAMGWYAISPGWFSIWPTGSAPTDYTADDPDALKVIIMMTDGIFDDWRSDAATYGDGWARAETFCAAAKAKGVYVYSIIFDLSDTTAETTMRNCATSAKFFYAPNNGADLTDAYASIARSIAQLRLKT